MAAVEELGVSWVNTRIKVRGFLMQNKQTHDDTYKMLSEAGYSDKAIEYFQAKENMGVLAVIGK